MNAKLFIALVVAINCCTNCGAALRRTPKVYNALITSDENLTSSRAYPVIQPTVHEPGVAHFPFGPYSPFGFYSPPVVRFGPAIAPGLQPQEQLPFPLPYQLPITPHQEQPYAGFPLAPHAAEAAPAPAPADPAPVPSEQQPVQPPSLPDKQRDEPQYMPMTPNQPQAMPNEKLPIALNEFGLPPSLIPLPQYNPHTHENPVSLPTYGYSQYPVIYDPPIFDYREHYLPPFDYFPSHHFAYGTGASPSAPSASPTAAPHAPPSSTSVPPNQELQTTAADARDASSADQDSATDVPNIESIKNVSKNKNHAVPDVPPPPIPSGAKAKKQ